MKKPLFVLLLIGGLVMVLLSGGTYAADPATNPLTHDPKIQERFENQQKRIDAGVKAGSLTQAEAALVQDNLNRIKEEEAKLKAAGQLTPEAKKRLNQKLDLNSQKIKAGRHNPKVQSPPNPASPALQTPSTTPSATPLPIPTPSTPSTTPPATVPTPSATSPAAVPTPSTTPPAASLPVPSSSTPEGDLKRSSQEREQDSRRDMGRRHMSKEEHERMKAERKAEREKRKAERKARRHDRDKDDNDDEDKDDDKDDEKGHGKKKGKHGRERD